VNLRDTTRDRYSVSQVEQLAGYPIEVVENPSLQRTAVAFQQFAPGTDVGIDLAREYEASVAMRGEHS